MAISLGRAGGTPTGGSSATGIISVTWTRDSETADITHRGTVATGPYYKAATGTWVAESCEIECLDATAVVTALHAAGSGYTVTSLTENQPLDGPVTFTLTVKAT
jgi:hypothetical protein